MPSNLITFIAGDIGGTNSRLQLFQRAKASSVLATPGGSTCKEASEEEVLLMERIYSSQKFASLTFIIESFLKEAATSHPEIADEMHPVACCLAVAGPVRANRATITNVSWTLDGAEMSKALRIADVLIINDFVGVGYGLLALTRDDVIPINDVPLANEAPKACLGAGTGLGEVYLTAGHMLNAADEEDEPADSASASSSSASASIRSDAEYNVWASEGGHADFAPRDALEFGLLEYFKAQERVTRVSVERIVSGMGIPKIYEYYAHQFPQEVNATVTERLRVEDPGAVIARFAANGQCNLCRQTIELFVKCYGAEAGNLALKMLPFGGLFIAGGIAPKLREFMQRDNLFYRNFVQKGRMQSVLEKVPVFIVTHPSVGLLGAKVVCRRLLRKSGFMPGRGELASFSEATPRGPPASQFSYPLTAGIGDGPFELQASPSAAEPAAAAAPASSPTGSAELGWKEHHAAALKTRKSERNELARQAFRAGILGGAVVGLVGLAAASVMALVMRPGQHTARRM